MSGKIYIVEENQDFQNPVGHPYEGEGIPLSTGMTDPAKYGSGLIIDKAAYTVYLKGDKISFPKKEFELLLLLASNPRKVFKRDEILRQIWGANFKQKDSRSLDVHIRMLRKKLSDNFITTIRGVGYKLEK
ncbi:MAG TPA: winged helix-turn-helix domain-containing protein [Bacteroidia bacterium]|nr:winged helix-turn-helix domain-containing protein [Bacteroidia bacterium]